MCYSPITIINPCKYIDVNRKDRFLLQVPCSNCADCQQRKSAEWNFRTYYEFINLFESYPKGYVYFDTLTYSDAHLPHLSDLMSELPSVPCFRTKDVQNFLKRLRINLSRKFNIDKDAFSYFIASEYGSLHGRPHYHILLFIRSYIDPLKLSVLVSSSWNLGRTDGVPYQSNFYVSQHNVIRNKRLGDILAAVKYVTKYVEKDCKLQETLDKRIRKADLILTNAKLGTVKYKKMLRKIISEVNQFHLQSLHFGELALRDIDLDMLFKTGCLRMPSHEVVSLVPLPDYYSRKLFYNKYKIDGNYGWQLSELGKEYKKKRLPYLQIDLSNRLACLAIVANKNYDCDILADYVLNKRGRFRADASESTIEERLNSLTHYLYITQSDKEQIGVGISTEWLGNNKIGYKPLTSDSIPIKDFIKQYVYLDYNLERQLDELYACVSDVDTNAQLYYSRVQELKSLFKAISN